MKYPIGRQTFEILREDGFVYVDKTDLIYQLAVGSGIYFLCRPRRFGKSLTISTLEAYFSGRKELFAGLKIEQLEHDWFTYPIFKVDFNGSNFTQEGELNDLIETLLYNWESQYGSNPKKTTTGERFAYVLHQAHLQTGHPAVVLIDEYDKPILDALGTGLEDQHRNILKSFYSVFKRADADLQFVMLTGVTKFSQISVFSGFNQPYDISMDTRYEALCGITEEELYTVFAESIKEMAVEYGVSADEMKLLLKHRYDGYHFSRKMTDIYNPFSLLSAFESRQLSDFWFSTGTPTYLVKLLDQSNVNIQQLISQRYEAQHFIDYKADVEKPLPMIFQSGYLTIKDFDYIDQTYLLDFPNSEVRSGFLSILANDYLRGEQLPSPRILALNRMLRDGRTDDLRDLLSDILANVDYEMRKDKEWHFQYTFFLIFTFLSSYTGVVEKHSSHGRADYVVETDNHVYLFEFKLDGSADEALAQIETAGYAEPFAHDPRTLHRIGVNFSKATGTIVEWKER